VSRETQPVENVDENLSAAAADEIKYILLQYFWQCIQYYAVHSMGRFWATIFCVGVVVQVQLLCTRMDKDGRLENSSPRLCFNNKFSFLSSNHIAKQFLMACIFKTFNNNL